MRRRAISISSRLLPKVSASVGQAPTQAGSSPSTRRSWHIEHFWIFGFHESYSNFGMSNGQETMQKRQPMHLLPRQITGPLRVLYIALVRHAAPQAGCQQCMHCFLTNTSPFEVSNRLTTVHCVSLVGRTAERAPSF